MDIQEKFIIARWAYLLGIDFISDKEYNDIETYIKQNNLLPEYTSRGWSEDPCPKELLIKYGYEDWIQGVVYNFKTESIYSINSEKELIEKCRNINEPTRLSFKLDGFSLRLSYYNGEFVKAESRTRADGVSLDFSKVEDLFPKTIPQKGKVLLIGELYLKNKNFEEYKLLRNITSQRNAVRTAIANGDINYLGYKIFKVYSEEFEITDQYAKIQELGFPTPTSVMCHDFNTLNSSIKILDRQKKFINEPTDGLVLENSSMQYALRVGVHQECVNHSIITGYIIKRGMYNNAISVEIEPFKMKDKTVSQVSVTNIQTIIDYNLRVGYPIAFVERSGVNCVLDTDETEKLHLISGL